MQEDHLSIQVTGDGSPTLYSSQFEAHYHSTHGALAESQHVFIKEGLEYFIDRAGADKISILEFGFGTGLNALLTANYALEYKINVDYHGLEGYPIPPIIYENISYAHATQKATFLSLHEAPWNQMSAISSYFNLYKKVILFEDFVPLEKVDIIYFDAFAPSCQPHLWQDEILNKAFQSLGPQGILVTFCAQGSFKRALRALGMEVERIPGPPGKREMTRATKI